MTKGATPLFLALVKPTRFWGLPLGYFVLWCGASYLLFVATQSAFIGLAGAGLSYALARLAAAKEPYFLEIVRVALVATPPTRNRSLRGGDLYDG